MSSENYGNWLHQFVKGGGGALGCELKSGLGIMDIMLTYKGYKYIIETKVNRQSKITRTLNQGVAQISGKYLATEFCQFKINLHDLGVVFGCDFGWK